MPPTDACSVAEREPLPTGRGFRLVQIHPTLACNLTCLHCYSESAPHFRQQVPLEALQRFLGTAHAAGFDAISLSGGEPLLYRPLEELLTFARAEGFVTGLVTNGMLLETARARRILGLLDLVAVSIDGEPDLHNRIRNAPNAFEKMERGLAVIRETGTRFGILHSVTRESWASLLWLADFAAERGASLLQLHPLEAAGRARTAMTGQELSPLDLHRLYVLYNYLRTRHEPAMTIQLDLMHREYVSQRPGLIYADETFLENEAAGLETILDELVIDERGQILPFSYGLPDAYVLGTLAEKLPLESMFERFNRKRLPRLKRLLRRLHTEVLHSPETDLFNWGERLVAQAA
jgi:pyruvate-formate lyase-activating enzyme